MPTMISIILFLTFVFLSAIHFYWLFGGRWGSESVYPTKNDIVKPQIPGIFPTFIVASGLLTIGLYILNKGTFLNFRIPFWLDKYGLYVIAGIFIIRAIGEFKYVGFFKKIKQTKFGVNDTKYYSPLCLSIGILTIIMILTE